MTSLSLRFPAWRICRLLMPSFFNGPENENQFFLFLASLKNLEPFGLNTKTKILSLAVLTASVSAYDRTGTLSLIGLKMHSQRKNNSLEIFQYGPSEEMKINILQIFMHIYMSYLEKKNFL